MSPSITPLVAGFITLVMVVQISYYYALTSHLPDQTLVNQQSSRPTSWTCYAREIESDGN